MALERGLVAVHAVATARINHRGVAGGGDVLDPHLGTALALPAGAAPGAVERRAGRRHPGWQVAHTQVRRQADAAHQQVAVGVAAHSDRRCRQCGDALRPCCFGKQGKARLLGLPALGEVALALCGQCLPRRLFTGFRFARGLRQTIQPRLFLRSLPASGLTRHHRCPLRGLCLRPRGVSQRLCFSLCSQPEPLGSFVQLGGDALALQQGHGHLLRSGLLVLLQTLQATHLGAQLHFGLLTTLARRHR